MGTQKNVYNIIWIDDEIDTLLDERKERILEKNGFNLIGTARTFTEFVCLMDLSYDRVDAVITDANFSTSSLDPKSDRDLSGLVKVRESIAKYNEKRVIPFYLFTMRGDVLKEKCEDGELDYFYVNDRYFTKGQFGEMLEQIRKDVDHIGSSSFRIRKKYAKELDAASLIEGNEKILMNALLYDYSEDWEKTEDYFNPMRKIMDRILEECKKMYIIPKGVKLSGWARFLLNKDNVFSLHEEIMPKPLILCLETLIDITQDCSHGDGDLYFRVDSYVRNTKNINLFRSMLYVVMDLCLWFEERKNNYTSAVEEKNKWSIKKGHFVCEGEVSLEIGSDGRNVLVCENYLLGEPQNAEYSEGDIIGILKENSRNKYEFSYKKKDGTDTIVDKYAISKDIVKLS